MESTGRQLKGDWNDWQRKRVPWVMLAMVGALCFLFVRMYQLQIIKGHEFRARSENNRVRLAEVKPFRGLVVDRNGALLADNRPSFDVLVVPKKAKPSDKVESVLASCLGLSEQEMAGRMEKAKKRSWYKPSVVARDVGRDVLALVAAHYPDLPGVMVDVGSRRFFPQGDLAAHVVGYMGQINQRELAKNTYPDKKSGESVGRYGVEKRFEKPLSGRSGGRQVEVDARGRVVSVMHTVPATPGANVVLAIDAGLQETARRFMEGQAGAAVAMDPETGDILAMVSTPSFDPNLFVGNLTSKQWKSLRDNPDHPLDNKAISGVYPPGSTYKIVAAMAALEEGIVTPGTRIYCPGRYEYGDREFRDWKITGHGHVDLVDALAQSCDVYFYKVGEQLGVEKLAFYARGCGLGAKTGLGLDREADGLVPTNAWKRRRLGKSWVGGETLSVAIGQGFNLTTPLQVLSFTAAVANGGTRWRPRMVLRVETSRGQVLEEFPRESLGRLPISPENLEWIKKGLYGVVQGRWGTASRIRIPGLDIYGKTGTAQVVGRKDREKFLNETSDERRFQDHAWFTAFCTPPGKPSIAVTVLVEHGKHGSSAAAPVAEQIIRKFYGLDGV